MWSTSAFSSFRVLSLTLIVLLLGLPPHSSLVLGAPANTNSHTNTQAQTHAPSSQSLPQSPSATQTPSPSLDDELALVIDVPAATGSAPASASGASWPNEPAPLLSYGAGDTAVDDDVITDSESSLVLVGTLATYLILFLIILRN